MIVLAMLLVLVVPGSAPAATELLYTLDGKAVSVLNATGTVAGASTVSVHLDQANAAVRSTPLDPGIVGAASGILGLFTGVTVPLPTYPFFADATGPPAQESEVGGNLEDPTGVASAGAFAGQSSTGREWAQGRASSGETAESDASTPSLPGTAHEGPALRNGTTRVHVRAERQGTAISGTSTATMRDLSLLGGALRIDSVSVTVTVNVPAPGERANIKLERTVQGARLNNMPVQITPEGIEAVGQTLPIAVAGSLAQLPTPVQVKLGKSTTDANSASVEGIVITDGNSLRNVIGFASYTFVSELQSADASGSGSGASSGPASSGPSSGSLDSSSPAPSSPSPTIDGLGPAAGGASGHRSAAPASTMQPIVLDLNHVNFWVLILVTLLGATVWLMSLSQHLIQRIGAEE